MKLQTLQYIAASAVFTISTWFPPNAAHAQEGYGSASVAAGWYYGDVSAAAVPTQRRAVFETISSFGAVVDGALGVQVQPKWYAAGEASLGFFATDSAIFKTAIPFRVGLRLERSIEPLFVRVGGGFIVVPTGGETPEPSGPYGAFTLGIRDGHIGFFVRADVASVRGEYTRHTPFVLSIGVDFSGNPF